MLRAENFSASEAPDRRGEIKGSCSGRIPREESRRSQQLLKLREFVANSAHTIQESEAKAVKPRVTRRNRCSEPKLPPARGVEFPALAGSVLDKRCQRTTRLCVLIHPILPGPFAIETCRRSDCFFFLLLNSRANPRPEVKICCHLQPEASPCGQFTNRRMRTFMTTPSARKVNNTEDPP
jgi:hypothetical protein